MQLSRKKKQPPQQPLSKKARVWRWTKRVFLFAFASSLIYLLLCIFFLPPITLTQLGSVLGGYGLKRDYVSWSEISPNVKLAAMASEDQLFVDHSGFDWKSIEKSLEKKPKRKRARGAAASTISQQVAKNVFLWQGRGVFKYARKIPEIYFTVLTELCWRKKRILEVYLNVIEMGPGIFGIEAAAQAYFNKHASELSKAEAAMIIACLPNPKKYTVKPLSRMVQWRQAHILKQMANIEDDPEIKELAYRP
jgi:monofunctional glycosyltransferase